MEQPFTPQPGPEYPPMRRLHDLGAESLSHAELLSVILHGRNSYTAAQHILRDGGLTDLMKATAGELDRLPDVGPARAAQVVAAVELGRRLMRATRPERSTISSPDDAAAVVMWEMRTLEQESVRVLLLDTRNRLISIVEVYRGSLNTSMIRVGELFREAIKQNAAAIIVVHNHPSGDPSPSSDDIAITKMIKETGTLLDIPLHDHIIIGNNRFVSLKERGLGFS